MAKTKGVALGEVVKQRDLNEEIQKSPMISTKREEGVTATIWMIG